MPITTSGWAYVSCSVGGTGGKASGQGPQGSVQFITASDGGISGSAHLSWSYGVSPKALFLTGNLEISGTINATNYNVINHSISYLSASGDSKFGDNFYDLHQMTGSFTISGSGPAGADTRPALFVSSSGRVGINVGYPEDEVESGMSASLYVSGGMQVAYRNIVDDITVDELLKGGDYIIGVSGSGGTGNSLGKVEVIFPAPVSAGKGRLLIIKDELPGPRTATHAITASSTGGKLIDNSTAYYIYGTMAAATFYCDGEMWFVI